MMLNKLKLVQLLQPFKWIGHTKSFVMNRPYLYISKFNFSSKQDPDDVKQPAQEIEPQQQQVAQSTGLEQNIDQTKEIKQQENDYMERLQQFQTVLNDHILLDKFYESTSNTEYYQKMEQKLKDYEQAIGLSLSRLNYFPLASNERTTKKPFKSYNLPPQNVTEKYKIKTRSLIMANSGVRQHILINEKIFDQYIQKNDIQLLQRLRKTGAFAANSIIEIDQCKKIINTYFKLKLDKVQHAQLILNYIPYQFRLQQGKNRKINLSKETLQPLLKEFPLLDGKIINKFKLSWALAKLQHKNSSQYEVSNEMHSKICLRYLIRQLKNINICNPQQRDGSLQDRLKNAKLFEKQRVNDQIQLHRALFLDCGQVCLIQIVNWMISYFPTFQQFNKNASLLVTLLYLLNRECTQQINVSDKKHATQIYYNIIFNMIRNNAIFDSKNQRIAQHFINQVIPSALFNHAINGDFFEKYKNYSFSWSKALDKYKKTQKMFAGSIDFNISTIQQNSFAKKVYSSIQKGEILIKEFDYRTRKIGQSMAQNQSVFLSIKQNPQPLTKIQEMQKNQNMITQTDFIKSLIGQKYSLVYEYFNKHFKKQIEPILVNSVTDESVSQFYDFENEDTKAFYILWQFSKILREDAAPVNLQKHYLEVMQESQTQYEQPKRFMYKQENQQLGLKTDSQQKMKNLGQNKKKLEQKDHLSDSERLQMQFGQIQHIQKIQKPKQYKTHQKDSPKTYGKKKDTSKIQISDNRIKQQQLEQLIDTQSQEKSKYINDRGYKNHDQNKPNRANFSTIAEKKINGYQDFKSTLRQMQDIKIFNFQNCKTPEDIKAEFQSKIHLLNQTNYKQLFINNKIPIVKRGERLFKYFFLNQKIQERKQKNPSTLANINNLKIKVESQIGIIEKDYGSYLVGCPFMFPFAQETYMSLLEDQLNSYHRKSFKVIVSHRIAFATCSDQSSYHIDKKFIEIMCDICLKEKIGITLLQIAYLIYTNKMSISEISLGKICSTIYSFKTLRQDAFEFINKFCQSYGQKFKVMFFKSYVANLIKQSNYIELELLVNKLLAQLKQKTYKFDSKLSNDDNELLQKEWKGKQKNRYMEQIYELLEFLTESFQNEVPEFASELFQLYLECKENQTFLTTNQLNIAIIVYAHNAQKFNQIVNRLKDESSKISIHTLTALIKAMFIYPRMLTENLQKILKIALYQKNYDLDQKNLIKLSKIFQRIDKPMIYSTFLQYLIKNTQEISNQVKTELYKVLNKTEDDQSKQHIFGLLSLMFDRKKQKQRFQMQKMLKSEETKRKTLNQLSQGTPKQQVVKNQTLAQIAVKAEQVQKTKSKPIIGKSEQKTKKGAQTTEGSKKIEQEKATNKITKSSKQSASKQSASKQSASKQSASKQSAGKQSTGKQVQKQGSSNIKKMQKTVKTQKFRPKTEQDILKEIQQKSKGNSFDQNVPFSSFQRTSKSFKRNRSLSKFAQMYLIKDAQQLEAAAKKKKDAKGGEKSEAKASKTEVKGSKTEVKGSKNAKVKDSAKK